MLWTQDRWLVATGVFAALLVTGAIVIIVGLAEDRPVPSTGPSMRPTLTGSAPLEIDYDVYDERAPAVGDIVVVQPPANFWLGCAQPPDRGPCGVPSPDDHYSDISLVKRIVAGPGQRIAFAPDGGAIVDGRRAREAYILRCRPRPCGQPDGIVVPDGHYFVAGDNRPNSFDSREFGPIAAGSIDGRVVLEG